MAAYIGVNKENEQDKAELKELNEIFLGIKKGKRITSKTISSAYLGHKLIYSPFSRIWKGKNIWKGNLLWKY